MVEIDAKNCARCGGDHDKVTVKFLDNHEKYTHWAECPMMQQPILITIVEDE
tara:strand:+ start:831 stop:986 length:156 start_codon:yes stop_codon:yes gene_type:complete